MLLLPPESLEVLDSEDYKRIFPPSDRGERVSCWFTKIVRNSRANIAREDPPG